MKNKSLKALDTLKDEIIPDYALEYEDDEGYKNWVIELYQTIKQDLERKTQLEKENQDLKAFVEAYANVRDELLIKNEQLEEENKKLKEENNYYKTINKKSLNKIHDLINDKHKLKKTLEILKEKFKFKIKQQKYSNIWYLNYHILLDNEIINENEAMLLNEVLDNDK